MKKQLMIASMVAMLLLAPITPVLAQTPEGNNIVVATAHPSIVVDKGTPISFSIEIVNNSKDWQDLGLQVEGVSDWNPIFKQGGYTVRRVMVAPGKSQSIDLQLKPPETAQSQDYSLVVRARDQAGRVVGELRLAVALQDKVVSTGLRMTTQYPESRGQAGNTFSFRVTLSNDAEQDRPVNFAAVAPKGWEVTFKPAYESRQLTTMSMKGGSTQDITVDVAAPQKIEAGDYKVVVQASADKDRVELPLKVTIVGSYGLSLSTATGQLNARATVNSETKLTLVIRNTGTAVLQNVSFSAYKPDGWEVTFNPDKIDQLPVGESVQVNASLKPSSKALAGDYMVTINANASQTSDSKEIRVTVETPTTWGVVAIGAIIVVLGGLGLVFARFSRR